MSPNVVVILLMVLLRPDPAQSRAVAPRRLISRERDRRGGCTALPSACSPG